MNDKISVDDTTCETVDDQSGDHVGSYLLLFLCTTKLVLAFIKIYFLFS